MSMIFIGRSTPDEEKWRETPRSADARRRQ